MTAIGRSVERMRQNLVSSTDTLLLIENELTLLREQERLASDLHDLTIQRIFSLGLSLSSLIRRHPNLETALIPLIAETDQTIRELRVIIFDLSRNEEANGLCGGILDLVRRSSRVLGFSPSVELCGPIETYSTDTINTELLAVLGEALSNIARHAQATAASITIEATSQVITLTISDNGIGIAPDAVHGEGLNNLSQRAKRLGATVTIGPGDTSGTQIQLRVPTNPTTQHEDDPTGAVSDRPNLLADDLG